MGASGGCGLATVGRRNGLSSGPRPCRRRLLLRREANRQEGMLERGDAVESCWRGERFEGSCAVRTAVGISPMDPESLRARATWSGSSRNRKRSEPHDWQRDATSPQAALRGANRQGGEKPRRRKVLDRWHGSTEGGPVLDSSRVPARGRWPAGVRSCRPRRRGPPGPDAKQSRRWRGGRTPGEATRNPSLADGGQHGGHPVDSSTGLVEAGLPASTRERGLETGQPEARRPPSHETDTRRTEATRDGE